MSDKADALVIGAGPAGSATAILLARAGWKVVLVEQDVYPRRKVCGECLGAASLVLLDELGVGEGVRAHAGPELQHIAWMCNDSTVVADFPACTEGPYSYGRALRREHLDALLVDRAVESGVTLMQPAKVRAVQGGPGVFRCEIESPKGGAPYPTVHAAVVIDAHGSWQRGPQVPSDAQRRLRRNPHHRSDLFAFKAEFQHTRLKPGLLYVLALPGGYGGMVIADEDRAILACCLRRDSLAACRAAYPGLAAGQAVEAHLRGSCLGVREALEGAQRVGPWLTVGPLRPGTLPAAAADPFFRVGNAAAESHPLIGEGIGMALQSAVLLAFQLTRRSPPSIDAVDAVDVQRHYAVNRHEKFSRRLRVAALYAHVSMRPGLTDPIRALLRRWPSLLTQAARLAGKARLSTPIHMPSRNNNEHA